MTNIDVIIDKTAVYTKFGMITQCRRLVCFRLDFKLFIDF